MCTTYRQGFLREVEILSGLQDANIARVVGVSTLQAPFSLMIEYLCHGPLCEYLRAASNERALVDVNSKESMRY